MEEFTDCVQSIPAFQECAEDVKTRMASDAEDCGFQMLNDDEIDEQEEFDLVDDETDKNEDNNNESSKGPSNADVLSALETAMEWFEQQSECLLTQLLLLKGIRELSANKRRCAMIQRKISNSTIKVKLRHFASILLYLQARFLYVMIFNIRMVSSAYIAWIAFGIRLSEQSHIRTVSEPN
ncbi:uncharacterized protein TNCV_4994621 [Trichonephila clavipes]|nr:uncharacterized protein TNCV_4994621 [Trichonephila clavipes]